MKRVHVIDVGKMTKKQVEDLLITKGMRNSVLTARSFNKVMSIGIIVVGSLAVIVAILPLFFK